MIDKGSTPLKIATFNGGLFDETKHPFLVTHRVGDRRLEQALDLIARVPVGETRQRVDYRDLATRHLGTIYEGLLEYHLAPLSAPERDNLGGQFDIALLNDRGERKASGSYYTPDFVVEYIVERTIGPACDRVIGQKESDAEKIERLLAVNVLDPAMGSGHFLVEATEYIARRIAQYDTASTDPNGGQEISEWKRRVAQGCIYGVDKNELAVELAKLSLWLTTSAKDRPLSFLDHHLRHGDSLAGTSLEALRDFQSAVRPRKRRMRSDELQTSLLDDDAFRASIRDAVVSMELIEANPARTAADVKEQERLYAILRKKLLGRYGRALNLVAALQLGSEVVDATVLGPLLRYTTGGHNAMPKVFDPIVDSSENQAYTMQLFHWELEFPDVFFNTHGEHLGNDSGFDAVIGNPPYIRESGNKDKFRYVQLAEPYRSWYHGKTDLYFYFFMRGFWLLKESGTLGYITPVQWMEAVSSAKLREFLVSEAWPSEITVFDGRKVFEDAGVEAMILLGQRRKPTVKPRRRAKVGQQKKVKALPPSEGVTIYRFGRTTHRTAADVLGDPEQVLVPTELLRADKGWHLKSLRYGAADAICKKVEATRSRLIDFFVVEAGVNTGADRVSSRQRKYWPPNAKEGDGIFVLRPDELARLPLSGVEMKYLKRIAMPEEVDRYCQAPDNGTRLIYLTRKTTISDLPNILAYLERYKTILENRAEIRRNPGRQWWHLLWPRDQVRLDAPEKLVIANATRRNAFYLDSEQTYYNIGCTMLSPRDNATVQLGFVLAVLNSSLYDYYYGLRGQTQSAGQRKYFPERVENIPIRFSRSPLRAAEEAQVRQLIEGSIAGGENTAIRALSGAKRQFALDVLGRRVQTMLKELHQLTAVLRLNLEGLLIGQADVRELQRLWTPPNPKRGSKSTSQTATLMGPLQHQRIALADFHLLNETQWKALVLQRLGPIKNLAGVVAAWQDAIRQAAPITASIRGADDLIDTLVFDLYALDNAERTAVRAGLNGGVS